MSTVLTSHDLRCPATGKAAFVDEETAERHLLRRLHEHGYEGWRPRSVYRCSECHWWHLASHAREKANHSAANAAEGGNEMNEFEVVVIPQVTQTFHVTARSPERAVELIAEGEAERDGETVVHVRDKQWASFELIGVTPREAESIQA
jgi:hypothetical protein